MRKPGLYTQNTPTHITVRSTYSVYFRNLHAAHDEIPCEQLHKLYKFYSTLMFIY